MTTKIVMVRTVCAVLLLSSSAIFADDVALELTDTGSGAARTVTVESKGLFRLGFESVMNFGMSQWFDLVNDKEGKTNLTRHTSPDATHLQRSIFNHVFSPEDYIANYDTQYVPDIPRSIEILENTPARVRIRTTCVPLIMRDVASHLQVTTIFTIYPSGRIIASSTLLAKKQAKITEWRFATVGLADPTFSLNSLCKGSATSASDKAIADSSRNWTPDQWKGYQVEQANWNCWQITGNTPTELLLGERTGGSTPPAEGKYDISSCQTIYGWLRCTDKNNPYKYQGERSDYAYEYWDPKTPEPYANWTKASILIASRPGDQTPGYAGSHGLMHSWQGFKRMYYVVRDVSLNPGDTVTHLFMIQLGAKNCPFMPDFGSEGAPSIWAKSYLAAPKPSIGGFSTAEGAYIVKTTGNRADISWEDDVFSPAIILENIPGSTKTISVSGAPVSVQSRLADGRFAAVILGKVAKDAKLNISW